MCSEKRWSKTVVSVLLLEFQNLKVAFQLLELAMKMTQHESDVSMPMFGNGATFKEIVRHLLHLFKVIK